MKRFLTVLTILTIFLIVFCGCSSSQIDRGEELKEAMDTCDNQWTQAFPDGKATFIQLADHVAGWAENAGLEVTDRADHYIVLTNSASRDCKDTPSVTISCAVDPSMLRDNVPLLSLGMTSVLGPQRHGKLRLILTEENGALYPGAESIDGKYLKSDHFIHLYRGSSAEVYTAGAMTSVCKMTCPAKKKAPSYSNAYEITLKVPDRADPYDYDQETSIPNPINVIGDLLASAKSSGRLFHIASFNCKENGDFLPTEAKAVIVIDDNSVEAIQKRFDASLESVQKRFDSLELDEDEDDESAEEAFTYTMTETRVPKKVLRNSACNNIISLMYTLPTEIILQDEATSSITAASYIRSVSTRNGKFSLVMDMRGRDDASMEEMASNYLITSGLCDVSYEDEKAHRMWSSAEDSSLAAWFTATINDEEDDPIRLSTSECSILYSAGDSLDMIDYRWDKDHRTTALENLLTYEESLLTE